MWMLIPTLSKENRDQLREIRDDTLHQRICVFYCVFKGAKEYFLSYFMKGDKYLKSASKYSKNFFKPSNISVMGAFLWCQKTAEYGGNTVTFFKF